MVSTSRKKESLNERMLFQLDRKESWFPLTEMENLFENTFLLGRKTTHFFPSGFSFTNIHDSQGSRGRGTTPLYNFHPLHRHLDISLVIAAESSPLHIASSWTRTGNLCLPSAGR